MIGRPPRWLPNLSPAGIPRGLDGANLVGADIVEVAPVYDHVEITCIAASHVAFELLRLSPGAGSCCPGPLRARVSSSSARNRHATKDAYPSATGGQG